MKPRRFTVVGQNTVHERESDQPSEFSAWIAGLIVLVLVFTMGQLGFWQLRRHSEVRQQNVQIVARSSTPIPVEKAPLYLASDPDQWDFQLVTLTGRWLTSEEVLWRGRNRLGVPGFEILTPFVVEEPEGTRNPGHGYLVDRGFLPDFFEDVPTKVAVPPTGLVEITAIARPSVSQPGFGPQDPLQGDLEIVFHADVPRIDEQVSINLVDGAYLRLVSADPATESEILRPLVAIEPDAGPHLGYALQWFGFSLSAIAAYLAWMRSRFLPARRARQGT